MKTIILVVLVIALSIMPFFMASNSHAEFGGSDDQAERVIAMMKPDYQPWFHPIFEPASGEIESLLFTLQGSFGVGVICFIFGYMKGKRASDARD